MPVAVGVVFHCPQVLITKPKPTATVAEAGEQPSVRRHVTGGF